MQFLLVAFLVLLVSCRPDVQEDLHPTELSGGEITPDQVPGIRIVTFTPTVDWTLTPSITFTPTPSPSPDPYAELIINFLRDREYGGGELVVIETLAENSRFIRYLVRYPSDGLDIYGFLNVPVGEGPFPVVIALHGYIEPNVYTTLDYTTGYTDELTRHGFLVIHPNLRGYPPSDDGFNLFRIGMAIDVLNLIAIVKDRAGKPGPLEKADRERLGLWGHSMGGGIAIRVITVSPEVDAALLYGAMSGDERKNYARIFNYFSEGERGQEELGVPDEAVMHISPINFLENINGALSIHHGIADTEVPVEWSIDLCERLKILNKPVECHYYPDQPHTFIGEGELQFNYRMVDFFNRTLDGKR